MLNDHTRKRGKTLTDLIVHSLLSSLGFWGPLEKWIRLLQVRGGAWGFISTVTASSLETPAGILQPQLLPEVVGGEL